MPTGFVLRCMFAGLCVAGAVLAWRWLRPSRAHVLCALAASMFGGFADWWIEVLLFKAGVWEHLGRLDRFSVLDVPLEMPLSFIPAGMAGLWLMGLGPRLRGRISPAGAAAALYAVWCSFGVTLDALNLYFVLTMRTGLPLVEVVLLYDIPFWALASAGSPFVYWLGLALSGPGLTPLDVRSGRAG